MQTCKANTTTSYCGFDTAVLSPADVSLNADPVYLSHNMHPLPGFSNVTAVAVSSTTVVALQGVCLTVGLGWDTSVLVCFPHQGNGA